MFNLKYDNYFYKKIFNLKLNIELVENENIFVCTKMIFLIYYLYIDTHIIYIHRNIGNHL